IIALATSIAGSLPWTAEEQHVAVDVLELETAQTVVVVLQRRGERDVARSELGRERIGIRNVEVRVPASTRLALAVRQRSHADVLEQDHRAASANDAEERIVGRSLEHDLEPEPVAVERERRPQRAHDEERRDAGDLGSVHSESALIVT